LESSTTSIGTTYGAGIGAGALMSPITSRSGTTGAFCGAITILLPSAKSSVQVDIGTGALAPSIALLAALRRSSRRLRSSSFSAIQPVRATNHLVPVGVLHFLLLQ
jgi:hypothetical protein